LKRLDKENTILNKINHENLIKCYLTFSDKENFYFVMEYLEGGNVKTLVNKYRLKDEVIKLLIAEVLLAIDYLHNNFNISHNDIKLENILITRNVSILY